MNQDVLKEYLEYNPETGIFKWIKFSGNSAVGNKAGWDCHGYIYINLLNRAYPAHILAFLYMEGKLPIDEVDHINHIKNDNRWINLRVVTHAENGKNQKLRIDNTSGMPGVTWRNDIKKWRARIKDGIDRVHLGNFNYYIIACAVKKEAEIILGYHENHGLRDNHG